MGLPPSHQTHQNLPLTYPPKQATHAWGLLSCPTPKQKTKAVLHKDSPKPSLGRSLPRPSQGTRTCTCHLHLNRHITAKKGRSCDCPKDKTQERLGPFQHLDVELPSYSSQFPATSCFVPSRGPLLPMQPFPVVVALAPPPLLPNAFPVHSGLSILLCVTSHYSTPFPLELPTLNLSTVAQLLVLTFSPCSIWNLL